LENTINKLNKKTIFKREYVTIETPDKIKIQYKIATPLLRFAALIIDFFLFMLLIYLTYFILSYFEVFNYFSNIFNKKIFSSILIFFYYITMFLLYWGYYLFFEIMFNGKTPGKFILKLRTIHFRGKFLDIRSIVLRNFMRLFDMIPIILKAQFIPILIIFIPLPAFICMLINKDSKRLGDIVADTVVIIEEKFDINPPDFTIKTLNNIKKEDKKENKTDIENKILVKKLSEEDLYILRKYINSLDSFQKEKRDILSKQMAETIKKKINDDTEITNSEEYLKQIYMRHKNGN